MNDKESFSLQKTNDFPDDNSDGFFADKKNKTTIDDVIDDEQVASENDDHAMEKTLDEDQADELQVNNNVDDIGEIESINFEDISGKNSEEIEEETEEEEEFSNYSSQADPERPKSAIVKKLGLAFVLISTVSGGYLFASWKGYVSPVLNPFIVDENGTVDTRQTALITKLTLQLNDLKNQQQIVLDEMAEQKRIVSDVTVKKLNALDKDLTEFKYLTDTKFKMQTSLSEANEDLINNKHAALMSVLNETKMMSTTINDKQDKLISDLRKNVSRVNNSRATYAANAKASPIKKASAKKTSETINDKVITSFGGYRLTNTYSWSSQFVAVLSNSSGESFQVSRGNNLGSSTVTEVQNQYLIISDNLHNKTYKLVKGK